jgi:hypothetical protein
LPPLIKHSALDHWSRAALALPHVVAQRLSMSDLVVQQLSGYLEVQQPLTGFEKHLLRKYKELDVSSVEELLSK